MTVQTSDITKDTDDPIKMKAIVLSLRMFVSYSVASTLPKDMVKEIAYGEDKTTEVLVEVANMK